MPEKPKKRRIDTMQEGRKKEGERTVRKTLSTTREENSSESLVDKYSNFKVDKKRVEQYKKELDSKPGGSSDFIELKEGEKKIRLLPSKDPTKDRSFVKAARHYLDAEEDGKKLNLSILCKGSAEKGCLGCQLSKFLDDSDDDSEREIGKRIKPSTRFYFGAYDREADKVGVLTASQTLASKIITPLSETNPYHPITGRDFTVIKKKDKRYFDYSESHYAMDPSPLVKPLIKKSYDEDQKKKARRVAAKKMEEILAEIPDLSKFESPDSKEVMDKFISKLKEMGIYNDFLKYKKRVEMDRKERESSHSLSEEDIENLEEYEEEEMPEEESEEEEEYEEEETSEDADDFDNIDDSLSEEDQSEENDEFDEEEYEE